MMNSITTLLWPFSLIHIKSQSLEIYINFYLPVLKRYAQKSSNPSQEAVCVWTMCSVLLVWRGTSGGIRHDGQGWYNQVVGKCPLPHYAHTHTYTHTHTHTHTPTHPPTTHLGESYFRASNDKVTKHHLQGHLETDGWHQLSFMSYIKDSLSTGCRCWGMAGGLSRSQYIINYP